MFLTDSPEYRKWYAGLLPSQQVVIPSGRISFVFPMSGTSNLPAYPADNIAGSANNTPTYDPDLWNKLYCHDEWLKRQIGWGCCQPSWWEGGCWTERADDYYNPYCCRERRYYA